MKRDFFWKWVTASTVCGVVTCLASVGMCQQDVLIPGGPVQFTVRTLDDAANAEKTEKDVLFLVDGEGDEAAKAPEGEYWLGLQIAVLPEVAMHQLGVKHGLAVEHVVPESPAAKAEIKRFDILLKADETPLKEHADLVKSVEGSQGKEIVIAVVRSGKEQKVRVTAAKRPASEGADFVRVPRPELAEEIKRLEEALHKLKTKAGDGSLGLWFARPAIVAPRVEVRGARPTKVDETGAKTKFPGDLTVRITKEGEQPAKIHVKRGDKEWNVTEDKLNDLPEEIRPHVQQYLGKPMSFNLRVPTVIAQTNRSIRVTPEGKVEGELRIDPRPSAAPVAPTAPTPPVPPTARVRAATPVAPASPSARIFSYRTETKEEGEGSKLDAILKKLDQIEDGSIAKLKEEVKQLRKELDEVRTKSPGDRK